MKVHMTRLIALAALTLMIGACTTAVRYSPAELSMFPPDVQERIKKKEVALGMTNVQVRYSWGAPAAVKVMTDESGNITEVWTYTTGRILVNRLYFQDGKLVGETSGTSLKKPLSVSNQNQK